MKENQSTPCGTEKVKKPKKHHRPILFASDIVLIVIMSIITAAMLAASFVLYFCDFGLSPDLAALLKSLSAPSLICGLAFILYITYRTFEDDSRTWLKVILTLVYILLSAGVLYFNWYNCASFFANIDSDGATGEVLRYIMWADSVSCALGMILFYVICVRFREWGRAWDPILTILMMTFLPIVLIVGFVVVSVGGVIAAIMLPGKAIQKSVDSDLAARSSDRRTTYTVRNEYGYEQTAYSDNGQDFYGSDGSYIGHKD